MLTNLGQVLRNIEGSKFADTPDRELLDRFVQDGNERAFEMLLRRHGPMVQGVCRRILCWPQDVDDAFQTTFLILVRKARSIRKGEAVGSWLYRVAYHAACKARAAAARRREADMAAELVPQPGAEATADLRPLIDRAVNQLPEKYRQPIVLCYLQGKSNEEAAVELGCPVGTVWTRLNRGRDRLRGLIKPGELMPATAVTAILVSSKASAAVPTELFQATMRSALALSCGGVVSTPGIVLLVNHVSRVLFLKQLRSAVIVLAMFFTLAGMAWLTVSALTPAPESRHLSFPELHALLRPQPGESRWREIDWLTDFWPARQMAAAEGKPILLSVAGKGYPFTPAQPTCRQGRMPSLWTRETARLVKENFIAVAADGRVLMARQDAEGDFIRNTCGLKFSQASYRLVCLTASGRLLGHDPHQAWQTFKRIPIAERGPGVVAVKPLKDIDRQALSPQPPANGMIVNIYARPLTRQPDGTLRRARVEDFNVVSRRDALLAAEMIEASPDHLWLTENEWRGLVPSQPRQGERFAVPSAITRRILLYHLTPRHSYTVGAPWRDKDLRAGELTLTVQEHSARVIRLRLEGKAELGAVYAPQLTVEQQRMGYEAEIEGVLVYDRQRQVFTRFDAVVLGEVYGNLPDVNGKCSIATRPGRQPLGYAFELITEAKPIDRLPPTGRTWKNYFPSD